MHDQYERAGREHGYGREVARVIVWELLVEGRVARVGGGRDERRLSVGRRLGDDGRSDRAACAGAVLHHDRLAPRLVQLLSDHAREDVGAAAGRKGHDDAYRAAGIGLRAARVPRTGRR